MNRRLYPRINFKAYRKPRYLIAVYENYGVGYLSPCGRFKRGECLLCCPADPRARCCSWNFETCSFYCHKCKKRGDALQLMVDVLGCSVVEAAKWLEQKAGPSGSGLVASSEHA